MATQFKSFAVADISDSGGSPTDIIDSSNVGTGQYGVIIGVLATNKSGGTRYLTLMVEKDGGDTVEISSGLSLPPNVSFEFMNGNKIVLEESDVLSAYTDTASSVDVIVSVMINDA